MNAKNTLKKFLGFSIIVLLILYGVYILDSRKIIDINGAFPSAGNTPAINAMTTGSPLLPLAGAVSTSGNSSVGVMESETVSADSIPSDTAFEEYDIRLMMVGDNLMHMGVVATGRQPDGTRDYACLYAGIKDFIDAADISIINQETILGGNELGFSGFPYFNSPTEVGDSIAAVGFNVVLHASNHAADQGLYGLANCAEFWETHPEVLMVGITGKFPGETIPSAPVHSREDNSGSASAENAVPENDAADPTENTVSEIPESYEPVPDSAIITNDITPNSHIPGGICKSALPPVSGNDIPILEIKGVTFAILNYTYGPNLGTIPSEIVGHLNMLCAWNESNRRIDFTTLNPQVLEDIKRADEIADVVIVCPHWGTEYVTEPSGYQQTFAMQMTEAGADLIIGTHPHVVQPVEWITAENGRRSLCFYSLGNYVSTQQDGISMLEAMAWVTFHVTEDGVTIDEDRSGAIPLVCHYTSGPVRIENVYLLENYTEEQASSHGIRYYGGSVLHLDDLNEWKDEILSENAIPASAALP